MRCSTMRAFLCLCLLAFGSHLQAQAPATPDCFSKPYGEGTVSYPVFIQISVDEVDEGRYWGCLNAAGKVTKIYATAKLASYSLVMPTFDSSDSTPQKQMEKVWRANVQQDCRGPTAEPRLKAVCDLAIARARVRFAPLPPARQTSHEVAPLAGATDRPARRVVNGALVTIPETKTRVGELTITDKPLRVDTGVDCDESVQPTFPSGSDLWMAVVGQPTDLRWLCRKRNRTS